MRYKIARFIQTKFNKEAVTISHDDGGLCIDISKINFWGRLAIKLIMWKSK